MVERSPSSDSVIDLLDRVLDKGIVVDASIRVAVVGIDLITVEARVVVASIATYLSYAQALAVSPRETGRQRGQELLDDGDLAVGGNELEAHRVDDAVPPLHRTKRVVRDRTLVDQSAQRRP